jgi:hypothetical protein
MLRFQTAIATGLATLLVVPAVVLGEGELESLERALAATLRALDVLAGVQQRVEARDARAIDVVRSATEAPLADARVRDERLQGLRHEVALLETELDALEAPSSEGVERHADGLRALTDAVAVDPLTTGLDDAARAALDRLAHAQPTPALEPEARTVDPATPSPEGAGYSADPLRHAQACLRAERWERAVELVRDQPESVPVLQVRARALERLDRLDEASKALRRILELAGAETFDAQRARTDLEFVEWKRGFRSSLPKGLSRTGEHGGARRGDPRE